MIDGIGTDIVAIARIEAALARHGRAFAERLLGGEELAEFSAHAQPARFLAKRFAAKEAFAKATGLGLRHPVSLQRICVTHDALGKPTLAFDAELSAFLAARGVSACHLSLSDERDTVIAFVVLERTD